MCRTCITGVQRQEEVIIFGIRKGTALFPVGDEFVAEFDELPQDKPLKIEVTQPRKLKFLRLYWSLCARIGKGVGKPSEWIDRAFKIETGHVEVYRYGGKEHLIIGSIAFHNMKDDGVFSQFFNSCVTVAYERWGVDPASVADLLIPPGQEEQRHG